MRTISRLAVVAAAGAAFVAALGVQASAGHDHFVRTPNGRCQQVALGSTSVTDPSHAVFHKFHTLVHLGTTESATAPDTLGDGRAAVNMYKDGCP